MSSQFKFKPDKIKYLSTIDTLDSSHKKMVNGINKKRDDMPKKEKKLQKMKNDLEVLDSKNSEVSNYISIRTKIVDEINNLTEEIDKIENYEDELEYYEKTHEILFNYYDIIDGHKIVSTNNINSDSINNINQNISNLEDSNQVKNSEVKNEIFSDIKIESKSDNLNNIILSSENITRNNIISDNIEFTNTEDIKNLNDINENKKNQWEIDGIEIFKKTNILDKLDILNQMSKMKRKEKKTTRKRVKNVESLVRDSNNIFDYLEANNNLINTQNTNNTINTNNSTNTTAINTTNINTINTKCTDNIINTNDNTINNSIKNNKDKYDRASLFEDYKILLDGYPTQKKVNKPCINCGPPNNKVLMYSEGFYVCLICGEVEKCIIENEITNYKDPMVEKPTFPYKRKNHFCEWIKFIFKLLI